MEVEQALLAAIERLAAEGTPAEIACLTAILACSGKVERRVQGWQHPFQEFAQRGGAGVTQALDGLARRGIVIKGRQSILLNSAAMSRDKALVATRCANRLFARARPYYTPLLSSIPFASLKDLASHATATAENRAYRNLGRQYWALRDLGLYACSNRTHPRIFPTLGYTSELPKVTAMALTLAQGNALTTDNLLSDVGVTYHLAVACGLLEEGPGPGACRLTDRGRELATAYVVNTLQRRLNWVGGCRDEAMHFLLDEVTSPLPAVWVDDRATRVAKAWPLEAHAPLRILLKDGQLRGWIRQLVRRLKKLGLAECIRTHDGASYYFFAPGVAGLAKEALGLPEERFALPPELQDRLTAFSTLFDLRRDPEGRWLVAAEVSESDRLAREAIQEVKRQQLVSRRRDGSLTVPDPDSYHWALEEILLGPVMAFLTSEPLPGAEIPATPEVTETLPDLRSRVCP